jgi:hypothetical protein
VVGGEDRVEVCPVVGLCAVDGELEGHFGLLDIPFA